MTFTNSNLSSLIFYAKEVSELLELVEFEEESLAEKQAIAYEFGAPVPNYRLEGAERLREVWPLLLSACGGDKALAADVSGCKLADIEYYLSK